MSARAFAGMLAVALFALVAPVHAHAATSPPAGPVAWLATGDSYSSGEGIAGTGTGTDTCAQSRLAYGPKAAGILHSQRGWTISPLAFSACTGALAGEFYNGNVKGHGSLWSWSQAQTAPNKKFDVITMSFGGNDINFPDVIRDCVSLPDSWLSIPGTVVWGDSCDVTEQQLTHDIDALFGGYPAHEGAHLFGPNDHRETLSDFYAEIADSHLTTRGELVVAGYPALFAPSNTWGAWRGYRCNMMSAADADMLGDAAKYFDNRIRAAVDQANAVAHHHIVYESRLDLFDRSPNHTLCSGNTEWLNGASVGFWDGSVRPSHSFHPNELGHQATAEDIAGVLDRDLAPVPTTAPPGTEPTTPPPPITEPGGHFDVGDSFDSECVVAWPTAPTHTTTSIEMTMSCVGVPQQYTFVDVSYPDPNLPITPSTGQVHVHGQIVDLAQSEFGFRELVVLADRVDLP